MIARWGEDEVTWENAPDSIKEQYALARLYWFFRMVHTGGPDGSDLDSLVYAEGEEAAEWFGPILQARAEAAGL